MLEYEYFGGFEVGSIDSYFDTFTGNNGRSDSDRHTRFGLDDASGKLSVQHRRPCLQPMPVEVRQSICVAGFHHETLLKVKHKLANLLDDPFAIESFHVKQSSDVRDGALLVPKIVLVGVFCAGRKLIDDYGDEGQLDFLYDEAVAMGADILVMYVGLPRIIYSHMKHVIYHPRMIDLVFPQQPILRRLADDHSFITLVQNSDFNSMQRNVIREWLQRPVSKKHSIYKVAESLSCDWRTNNTAYWSDTGMYMTPTPQATRRPTSFSATEDNDFNSTYNKKKKTIKTKRRKARPQSNDDQNLLMPLNEYPNRDFHVHVESDEQL